MIAASKGGLLGQLTEVMLRGELVSWEPLQPARVSCS